MKPLLASRQSRAFRKRFEQVHHALVEQDKPGLVHVQADEIRVKGCKMIVWMGLCADGSDAAVARRGSQSDARPGASGSLDAAGAGLCAASGCLDGPKRRGRPRKVTVCTTTS